MGRAPCCEKKGLNKGPWNHEEDQILISYVQKHGHPNWRALPKHAGLLRCGKSCRLRWTNYLRPDIKRGNFSQEEEEMIIHLHEELGNRWSVIAAKLPGRTDNEIKNVWHTHLKKRLESHQTITEEVSEKRHTKSKCASKAASHEEPIVSQCLVKQEDISTDKKPSTSSQPSSSESSSVTEATDSSNVGRLEEIDPEMFLDESFWSETLSGKGDDIVESNKITNVSFDEFPNTQSIIIGNGDNEGSCASFDMNVMDQWYDILPRMEELPELLPEF